MPWTSSAGEEITASFSLAWQVKGRLVSMGAEAARKQPGTGNPAFWTASAGVGGCTLAGKGIVGIAASQIPRFSLGRRLAMQRCRPVEIPRVEALGADSHLDIG